MEYQDTPADPAAYLPVRLTCPKCGTDDGHEITGVEVQGVYDGVLYWFCTVCSFAWARDWTGYGRRQEIADRYAATHNAGRA